MDACDRRETRRATIDAEQDAERRADWLSLVLPGLGCAPRREVERGVEAEDVEPIGWVS